MPRVKFAPKTKAEAIRKIISKNPNATAKTVSRMLTEFNMPPCSEAYVYMVRKGVEKKDPFQERFNAMVSGLKLQVSPGLNSIVGLMANHSIDELRNALNMAEELKRILG